MKHETRERLATILRKAERLWGAVGQVTKEELGTINNGIGLDGSLDKRTNRFFTTLGTLSRWMVAITLAMWALAMVRQWTL